MQTNSAQIDFLFADRIKSSEGPAPDSVSLRLPILETQTAISTDSCILRRTDISESTTGAHYRWLRMLEIILAVQAITVSQCLMLP